jgi:hypothetical protein
MTLARRRFLQAAGAGAAAAALTALPRPALAAAPPATPLAGQTEVLLDGDWAFATDPGGTGTGAGWHQPGFNDSAWARLPVPGNWDVHDAYAAYRGRAWYRRTIASPARTPGQVVRLRFEAVYYATQVWFNGTLLGGHSGGYTPFEFDVTALLRTDGTPNTVAVSVDNTYSIGAWWPWGGISRSVRLVVNEAVRVERQHVIPIPDLARNTAHLDVWVTVSNTGTSSASVSLRGVVTTLDGARLTGVPDGTAALTLGPGASGEARIQIDLPAGSFRLWGLDAPQLYRFTTTVTGAGGAVVHTAADRFGIRTIAVSGTSLLLNGERIRLNGYNRVGDDRVVGATEPDYLVRRDLDRMIAAGANLTRIHHVPQAPNLLDYADEKGLLLIEEIPVWGGGANLDPNNPTTRNQLRDMVRRDYNHPSIIAWSVCNEIYGTSAAGRTFVQQMIGYVRSELDSTRLLTYVSNSYTGATTGDQEALQYTDFACINMYGNFAGSADHAHRLFPDKPIFVSEYSSDSFTFPTSRELVDFRTSSDASAEPFRSRPWLVGASHWTYNDYRSGFGGSSPDQVRGWGVQNVWGQRKRAYDQLQAAYAPVRGIRVESSVGGGQRVSLIRVTPRAGLDTDAPSRALVGWRLAWQVTDASGTVLDGRLVDLAPLRPGDPVRSAGVSWTDPGTAATVRVSLLSPVGYEVLVAVEDLRVPSAPTVTTVVPCAAAVRAVVSPVAGATGYQLVVSDGTRTVRSAVSIDTQLDVTGLTNGVAHTVRAVAVNAKGESTPSAPTTVTPQAASLALPPVVQDVAPIDGGLVLGFVVVPGATSYQVQVSRAGTVVRDYSTTLVGSTRIEGLTGTDAHQVRIRGRNTAGPVTAWSQQVTGRPVTLPTMTVRGALNGVTSAGVRIVPDRRAEAYEVTFVGPGSPRVLDLASVDLLPVTGLASGTTYSLLVRVRSDAGWSAGVPVRVDTRPTGTAPVPVAPSGLTATVVSGQTTLSWTAVAGATGYLVTRIDGAIRTDVALVPTASLLLGATGDVAANTYVVAAFTSGGLGPASAPVITPGTPAPRVVTVTPAQRTADATGVVPYTETGTWLASALPDVDGGPTRYSNTGASTATWRPLVAAAANYRVEAWIPANTGNSPGVRYDITHSGGTATVTVDQLAAGGTWRVLGTWALAAGHAAAVKLTFTGGSGFARAATVRITPVP